MVTSAGRSAPYAPKDNVLVVIRRIRDGGRLPDPLTTEGLTHVGIPEGNTTRTMQAIKFLNLIGDDGERLPAFESLRLASTQEYPRVLADILRAAYHEVFTLLEPATASNVEFVDAFKAYTPDAQRSRMVTLFVGLCREAELIEGGPVETRSRPTRSKRTGGSKEQAAKSTRLQPGLQGFETEQLPVSYQSPVTVPTRIVDTSGIDESYVIFLEALKKLPANQMWTSKQRDKWLKGIEGIVGMCIEIVDEAESSSSRREDDSYVDAPF